MAYEIDININGGDFENDVLTPSELDAGRRAESKEDASKGMKAMGKYIVGQTITPMVSNIRTQLSQNVGLVTGSKELQERINFGMEIIETASSIYSSVQGGIAVASAAGLSTAAGGVIGLALAVVEIGTQIGFKQANITMSASLEDQQIEYTRSRAGAGFNKSRRS